MTELDAHEFSARALPYVKRQVEKYHNKYAKKTYNQHQYVVLNLLRLWWDCTYRECWKRVRQMPGVRNVLELESVPYWTNIQYAYSNRSTLLYRMVLKAILDDCETGAVVGMDASGFARDRASRHYTKRTSMTLSALKTTVLVDCDEGWILDIHITTTRKHDTKIGPDLITSIPADAEALVADKGYDDKDLRAILRDRGIEDRIKYCEYGLGQEEANAFMDERGYSKRSFLETVMYVLKSQFGETARSRSWHHQFKEMVGRAIVYNLDRMGQTLRLLYLWTIPKRPVYPV